MSEQAEMWTSREVRFTPHPRTRDEDWEAFFDAIPERFWTTSGQRIYGDLSIGSCDRVVTVACWPWWVPAWFARRQIANLAAACNVGGEAEFAVVRVVLPPLKPTPIGLRATSEGASA